jgi:hypothetical protein
VKSKKDRSRIGLLAVSVTALIVILVIGLAAVLLSPWSRYRRFVSQPLPDGTRYTFLYPAHLQNVQENGTGASPEAIASASVWTMNQSVTEWDRLRGRLGIPAASPAEGIFIIVMPLGRDRVRDRRSSERWSRGGEMRHNEHIFDARTKTQFNLIHRCPQSAAAQFERHNPTIVKSFRVLPPGADPALQ